MILSVRCSSLDRLFTCHGSRVLEEKVAAATIDPFGEGGGQDGHEIQWAGSWCHHHAAVRLRDEFGAVGIPDPLTIPESFKPSGYDEWVVDWYVGRVAKLIPSDWAMFIEREIKRVFPLRRPFQMINPQTGALETVTAIELTGHLDHTALSPDLKHAVIDDLKRGYEIVDPAEFNWQLAGYTALLLSEFPSLEKVLLRLHQPAAPERTTEAAVQNPRDVLALIEAELNALVEDPYTFVTGKPCKYCPALLMPCPVAKKDIKLMRETLTKEFIDSLPATASDEDLGDLAYHAKKLEYPAKRVVDAFKARLEQAGMAITLKDGITAELIEEDGPRQIADVQFAHTELSRKVGAQAAWKTLKMGVGATEDVLVADGGMQRSSKKKEVETAKTWIDQNLGGVIRREKQKTLVFR